MFLQEAVDWLCRHPLVIKNGIGVIGVSKGGALALDMAVKCPQVGLPAFIISQVKFSFIQTTFDTNAEGFTGS